MRSKRKKDGVVNSNQNKGGMSMKNLMVFENNDFGSVRVIERDGEPWFVAKDVCDILGLSNTSKALQDLKKKKKDITSSYTLSTAGGKQKMSIVNEQGLYLLIMQSRKPQAVEFQLWITGEVLPAIRKTGGYVADEELFVNEYFKDMDDATKFMLVEGLKAKKRLMSIEHSSKTYNASEIAKECGLSSAQKLHKILHALGIMYKSNGTWIFYSNYSSKGYGELKSKVHDNGFVSYFMRFTQKGREFIIDTLKKEGIYNG